MMKETEISCLYFPLFRSLFFWLSYLSNTPKYKIWVFSFPLSLFLMVLNSHWTMEPWMSGRLLLFRGRNKEMSKIPPCWHLSISIDFLRVSPTDRLIHWWTHQAEDAKPSHTTKTRLNTTYNLVLSQFLKWGIHFQVLQCPRK